MPRLVAYGGAVCVCASGKGVMKPSDMWWFLGYERAHMEAASVTKNFAYGVLERARGNAAQAQPCAGGRVSPYGLYRGVSLYGFNAVKCPGALAQANRRQKEKRGLPPANPIKPQA